MDEENKKEHLQEYIYKMFHLPNKDVYHSDNLLENRKLIIKDIEKQKKVVEILQWAIDRPEFDFVSILPITDYNNEEIYYYLTMEYNFRKKILNENGIV